MTLRRRTAPPFDRLVHVTFHAKSMVVHEPQILLGAGMASARQTRKFVQRNLVLATHVGFDPKIKV